MAKKKSSSTSNYLLHFQKRIGDHDFHTLTLFALFAAVVAIVFLFSRLNATVSLKSASATIGGGGGGPGPASFCSNKGYGYYCNGSGEVAQCEAGNQTGQYNCRCEANNLAGGAAFCQYSSYKYSLPDPCRSVHQGNGGYCGSNESGDGAGGYWGDLYYCVGITTVGQQRCRSACIHNNNGSDYCSGGYVTIPPVQYQG